MSVNGLPDMARLWQTPGHAELTDAWAAAIRTAPDLAGAACKGSTDWDWDVREAPEPAADRDARLDRAAAMCAGCPALAGCRAYRDALPERDRPPGVMAGQLTVPAAELRRLAAAERNRRKAAAHRAAARAAVAATGPPSGPRRYDALPGNRAGATAPHNAEEATAMTDTTTTTDAPGWGGVYANVHPDGRLVLTVKGAICPQAVEDLDEWHLLGRIQLAGDHDLDGRRKFSVLAFHRDTGDLARFYVAEPRHPSETITVAEAYDNPQWLSADVEYYQRTKPVWELLIQLPEITSVTIGTARDL